MKNTKTQWHLNSKHCKNQHASQTLTTKYKLLSSAKQSFGVYEKQLSLTANNHTASLINARALLTKQFQKSYF